MSSRTRRIILFGGVGMLAFVVLLTRATVFAPAGGAGPEALAERAIAAADPADRTAAASRLVAAGAPRARMLPAVRRALAETHDPAVRAALLRGVERLLDHQSMPAVLAGLEDRDPHVRAAAERACTALIGRDGFDAHADPAARARQVADIRAEWAVLRDSEPMRRVRERIEKHHLRKGR